MGILCQVVKSLGSKLINVRVSEYALDEDSLQHLSEPLIKGVTVVKHPQLF